MRASKYFVCNNEAVLTKDFWDEYKVDRSSGLKREASWHRERCQMGPRLYFPISSKR